MRAKPEDFKFVQELLYRTSAICIEPGQEYLVEARLGPLARSLGLASIGALVAKLRAKPANGLEARVVDAMTTNETMFFRDVHPFETLKKRILPEVIRARASSRRLTIWCGACSTGQEPYSVAMTIREAFPELLAWQLRILATDISGAAIDRAREGRYTALEIGRGLAPELRARHFEPVGASGEWRANKALRSMIEFRSMNLIQPWIGIDEVDVLFLRNVLIYFDGQTRKAILGKMRQVLEPHGALLLGCAETTMRVDDAFECVQEERTLFFRLRARAA